MTQPDGDSQNIEFSSDPDVFAYVPQIKIKGFPFPFLACDIDGIDHGLIGWEDREHNHDAYNLIFDVPHQGLSRPKARAKDTADPSLEERGDKSYSRPIFSVIKHYPPKWQIELSKKSRVVLGKKNE